MTNFTEGNLNKWLIQGFRLTIFPVQPIKNPSEIARTIANTLIPEPDEINERPSERSYVARKTENSKKIELSVQPIRVDFRFEADQAELLTKFVHVIGEFEQAIVQFKEQGIRIFDSINEINRIAFGCIMLMPVESHIAGYNELNSLLPSVKLDGESSSDFFYRINRTRNSKVIKNLIINRISAWGVAKFSKFSTIAQYSDGKEILSEFPDSVRYACRLELDVNTHAEYADVFPLEKAIELVDELIDLAKEIALKGDIK